MLDLKTLRMFIDDIKHQRGNEETKIRLAQVIRSNVAQQPELLQQLGLSQVELDQLPSH